MLTDEKRKQHMVSAVTYLQQYNTEGEKFLNRIVIGNDTWISCSNIETKKHSMV
jgi:hypothetical protein